MAADARSMVADQAAATDLRSERGPGRTLLAENAPRTRPFESKPLNDDFRELLSLLLEAGARFLVVGAHAMAVHGVPRATGDLAVWVAADATNSDKVWAAFTGVGFEEAWAERVVHEVAGLSVPFLGRAALVRNKRAVGRAKDLADLEALGESPT